MIRAAALLTASVLGFAQAPALAVPEQGGLRPAHAIAIYVDLDSPAASRAMVVLRAFTERHPGVASVELHLVPPDGRVRPVDRAAIAAQAQDAGLRMAELILANQGRRTGPDFVAMARQLRLNEEQFLAGFATAGAEAAVAADAAAAASLRLPREVGVVIDGQPLPSAALTVSDLESRLVRD